MADKGPPGKKDSREKNISSGTSPTHKQQQQSHHKKDDSNSPKKYHTKRRPEPKAFRRPNDVYISDSSNFQSQYAKCQKLLDGGEHKVIFLHGLGDAIPRALNLCAQLKTFYEGSLDYSVNTSTVKLIDDLLPTDDNSLPSQNYRTISAVDVKITRTEIGKWLGVTPYEIFVWVTSLGVFTVLLSIKCDSDSEMSWSVVFAPLFIGDAVNAYFVATVFLRMLVKSNSIHVNSRPAIFRILWSFTQLFLIFLFELFLCVKLNEPQAFDYSEVFSPIFILSQLYMIRACQN